MRIMLSVSILLVTPCLALAQASPAPTLGQCRDKAGLPIACASGAAATDSEAVPLAAKAQVAQDVSEGHTPQLASAAPRVVPAHCRDGVYDVGRTRRDACLSHAGVAPPPR